MNQSASNGDEETTGCCLHCGTDVEDADRRRIVSAVEDGEATHRQFCSEECLTNWVG